MRLVYHFFGTRCIESSAELTVEDCDPKLRRFDKIAECDGQTDGQTDGRLCDS